MIRVEYTSGVAPPEFFLVMSYDGAYKSSLSKGYIHWITVVQPDGAINDMFLHDEELNGKQKFYESRIVTFIR